MKKIFFTSGLLTVLLLLLYFTGIIDFRDSTKEALAKGNRLYTAGSYTEALQAYNEGLTKKPEDARLNFNAGQAAYQLKDYGKAIEYYTKARSTVDKYLNQGNASLKLGDAAADTDTGQKLQYYQQALQAYEQGILAFPQNIDLKYNYEYVKKKLEQLQNDNQNQQNNEESKDGNEEQKNNQSQEDNQEGNGQNNQQDNQQDQTQDEQQKQPENQQDNQQNGQGSNSQPTPSPDTSGSPFSPSGQQSTDAEQVQKVLEMLEKQEENSLKNNQEIINQGKEEEHDW